MPVEPSQSFMGGWEPFNVHARSTKPFPKKDLFTQKRMLSNDLVSPLTGDCDTHNTVFKSGKQEWHDHEAQFLTVLAGMQSQARFLYRFAMIHRYVHLVH